MPKEPELVMASVILKPRGKVSVLADIDKLSLATLDEFRPSVNSIDRAVNLLKASGYTIEAQTRVGISFSGPRELFESEFGVKIQRSRVRVFSLGEPLRETSFFESSRAVMMNDRFEPLAEAIHLAVPAVSCHSQTPPGPVPPYYFLNVLPLNVLKDVPARLNVASVHAMGIKGNGIRISMVDTGFINRVTETHASTTATEVSVDHPIRAVEGVWLSTDMAHAGTNYWTGGSFAGNTIRLGHPLPGPVTTVEVVYSCLHPHYTAQGYAIGDIRAVSWLDVNSDEEGHGTAEAANIFAVAPGATVSFVKANSAPYSFPLAGFQKAVEAQNPHIISCSWSLLVTSSLPQTRTALGLEIHDAVASGIVVVFSGGNGATTDNPGNPTGKVSVSYPLVISMGGAYPIDPALGGGFRASNFASSFDSFVYTNLQRHVPDVVGLVGETPKAILIMLPTQPGSRQDDIFSPSGAIPLPTGAPPRGLFPNGDNTPPDDGWCVLSGTSAAAPQAAGMAALVLERYPGIIPMAVKNILENSALDVTTGSSFSGNVAGPGWDAATGFGVINGRAAIDYLQQNVFNPYIRDSVEDNGTEPVVVDRLWASPDIIVRTEPVTDPQKTLGQTVKHRDDLCDQVEDGQDNYLYLRVQNRGTRPGSAIGTAYFTAPGMLANPAAWMTIGHIPIPNLLPGEFRVIGPLVWSDAKIPGAGHYCLISILRSANDPAPNLAGVQTTNDFVTMVRDTNNVAWRNIEVVNIVPGAPMTYSFYVQGPPDTRHMMDLDLDLSRFAPGVTVAIKAPKRCLDGAEVERMTVLSQSSNNVVLSHQGGIGRIRKMPIAHREKVKLTISYTVPQSAPNGAYRSVARLLVDGQVMGGYTHVASFSRCAFVGDRRAKEVHLHGCPRLPDLGMYNRIPLATLEEARAHGLANCATCLGGSS